MSIADVLLVCHLSCYNVFMPDALSAYPQIQQLRAVAEDRLSGWRIIHKEFELLRQCTGLASSPAFTCDLCLILLV